MEAGISMLGLLTIVLLFLFVVALVVALGGWKGVGAVLLLGVLVVPTMLWFSYASVQRETAMVQRATKQAAMAEARQREMVTQKAIENSDSARKETEALLEEALEEVKADMESSGEAVESKRRKKMEALIEEIERRLAKLKEPEKFLPYWMKGLPADFQKKLEEPGAQVLPLEEDKLLISSARWATIEEANDEAYKVLEEAVIEQVGDVGERYLRGAPRLTSGQLHSFVMDSYVEDYPLTLSDESMTTEMYRTHLLVDMSPEQVAMVLPDLREEAIDDRVKVSAGALLGVMVVAGGLGLMLRGWSKED